MTEKGFFSLGRKKLLCYTVKELRERLSESDQA